MRSLEQIVHDLLILLAMSDPSIRVWEIYQQLENGSHIEIEVKISHF